MDYVLKAETIYWNFSKSSFHRWAEHYYKCFLDFSVEGFSPVKYYLLCKSIKFSLKSFHLSQSSQHELKQKYVHQIFELYEDAKGSLSLSVAEVDVLKQASVIYVGKDFEYILPITALNGFSSYPSIEILDQIAKSILQQTRPTDRD